MERTNTYNDLKPFRFWCQKVLPLVYDDSLSYYELLDKVIDYLNKTMEDVTVLNDDTEALYAAYNQLQSYVNNYFDNLDVQQEIDNKLDAMVLDGTLTRLVRPFVGEAVSDWLEDNVNPVGSAVIVDASLTIEGAAADAAAVGRELSQKEDVLAFDDAPTAGSMAPVHSYGIKNYVDEAVDDIEDEITDLKGDLSQIEDTTLHVSPNLLNFDDENFLTGKYIGKNGVINTSSGYNTSGYIPVEEGATYTYTYGEPVGTRRSMRYVCAFDANMSAVSASGAENTNTYTVPQGIKYIRFSASSTYFVDTNSAMLYKGTSIDKYYPYYEPYYTYAVKNEALDSEYITGLIVSHAMTDYGLVVSAKADTLTSSDTMTVVQRVDNKKNDVIEFLGYFESFTSLTLGHGYNIGYGSYAVIDDTNITIYSDSRPTQVKQSAHGLTFSEFIHVIISQANNARVSVQIITASGNYTLSDSAWAGCNGDVFAKVGATMTGCICNAVFKDFNEKVFLFGDSYAGIVDPARFPYYLVQNGYTKLLIDGYGGRNSASALTSFENTVAYAVPKYAVWDLGMNDPDTTAINASWLACIQSFIATCEEKGITPILATIPNTPTHNNTLKNAWVKASDYRYVDFAKAVGAEEAEAPWYTGMLSSDNIHPTQLGAKALYARFIIDVPEVIRN